MDVEIKMNSKTYQSLLKEAIDSGLKRADERNSTFDQKVLKLRYFTSGEAMNILGYKNKNSLIRKLKEAGTTYRVLGKELYIDVDDMNDFIKKASRVHRNGM